GRGQGCAANRCADCHSIGYGETSPRAEAPSFAAIASTPGLDSAKLARWLEDHRNYPSEMYFEIPAEHIDDLTAYMLTLRRREEPGAR
ncbi:MAG: c-type cytochrome, partial [Cypionkella sp.]